ncbi:polysaccharide deacetylase family protein [Kitasatospora sp. NBC_00085]|uniref:polysaccharide deacetylase family protein n=1 Tax=unclassified Kitasatospora TaxID=2633591 RepID=UPI003243BD79
MTPTADRPRIVLSFDVEDVVTAESDDAIVWLADLIGRHGMSAGFFLTGDKARALAERGRTDVVNALRGHDIGFHSDRHSRHPTISEYLETRTWDEGRAEVIAREASGADFLRDLTGRRLWAFATPGTSWGPQIPATVAELGISSHVHSFSRIPSDDQPHWYAGALCFARRSMIGPVEDDLADAARFAALLARIRLLVAERAAAGGVVHLYLGHPTMFVNAEFWDAVNFADGRNPDSPTLRRPVGRSRESTSLMLSNLDLLLTELSGFADVVPFSEVVQSLAGARPGFDDGRLAAAVGEAREAGTVTVTSTWASPAQLTYVLCRERAGRGLVAGDPLPEVLGPTDPADPRELPANPPAVRPATLRALASSLCQHVETRGTLPRSVAHSDTVLSIGALYRTLVDAWRRPEPAEAGWIPVRTGRDAPDVGAEIAEHYARRSTGWLHSPALDPAPLAQLADAQSWSLRRGAAS